MTVKRIFPSDREEDYHFDESSYTFLMNDGTILEQTVGEAVSYTQMPLPTILLV